MQSDRLHCGVKRETVTSHTHTVTEERTLVMPVQTQMDVHVSSHNEILSPLLYTKSTFRERKMIAHRKAQAGTEGLTLVQK